MHIALVLTRFRGRAEDMASKKTLLDPCQRGEETAKQTMNELTDGKKLTKSNSRSQTELLNPSFIAASEVMSAENVCRNEISQDSKHQIR